MELGPRSCLLAGVRPRAAACDVFAVHTIGPDRWPDAEAEVAGVLREARIAWKLPRRATVVDWGLTEAASAADATSAAGLRPLRQAGFRLAEVIGPTDALARLAAWHHRRLLPGAHAWVALNTFGAAVAIVRGDALLYSRAFPWSYAQRARGSASHLLQRYSLVAHLAPELQRGLAQVRASRVEVNAVITCGNLPDLRSFTMPLVQELGLEVQTLDSTEGLRPAGRARDLAFADLAPALRLACAAVGRPPGPPDRHVVSERAAILIPIAGAAAIGLLVVAYPYLTRGGSQDSPPTHRAEASHDAAVGQDVRASPGRGDTTASAPAPAVRAEAGPPPATPSPARPDEPLPRLESILIDRDRHLALIDGTVVEAGQRVGSRTVVQIGEGVVVLREPSGRTVRISLRGGLPPGP